MRTLVIASLLIGSSAQAQMIQYDPFHAPVYQQPAPPVTRPKPKPKPNKKPKTESRDWWKMPETQAADWLHEQIRAFCVRYPSNESCQKPPDAPAR